MGARSRCDVRYSYKLFDGPDRKTLPGGERRKAGAPRRPWRRRLAWPLPVRGWCNRQHDRFWPCNWGFESSPPSHVTP